MARRALSVGVTRFERHERLDFAADRVRRLGRALADLGYDVREVAPDTLSGGELGGLVTGELAGGGADDLAVVHLVTHGERADGDATLFALGSDGVPHPDASIAHWLTVQQATEQPLTLFLLDLCAAGTSARLPWQVRLERPVRGWVVAACGPAESAYDGRFTEAVITVLRAVRAGELDIDPSIPHVPLSAVARAIRQEVNRLAEADDAYGQQVTASLVDISAEVEPAFFPNPAYDPSPRPRLRAAVDPGVLPFLDDLDEGLDARHFLERATGLGRLTDTDSGLVGCFTGRDRELRQVSPWLNGVGDEPLCVVTGSPGAGKSALLGVLVCAADPLLRATTKPVWNRVAQAPLPVADLAAVHARQRGLATVVASIARQLGLPESSTAEGLVEAVRGRSARPVVVVDALDEADDPAGLMTGLLLPLTDPDAPGTPVRLLVGVRRYTDFAPLFERAWVVDLDDVEQDVLEDNLFDYVKSLLRTTAEYRAQGGVTGAFAHEVARVLAAPDAEGRRRWGPFLVAGLYTRHFITANAERVVTDPQVAGRVGARVPVDLRGVLELDLESERDQFWLRPVMTALAHARGAGMPVSVLTRIAPVLAPPPTPPPTATQIRSVLSVARFYLRQSMDSDRSNLYRLFHQGLADTLAVSSPQVAGAVLDAMLSSLGAPGSRDWDAAEPYLFRHVAAHAADAGRSAEIDTDPGLLLTSSGSTGRYAGITSAEELALAAARAGDVELARRAANTPGRPPLTWQPRWTVGPPPRQGPVRPAAVEDVPDEFESIAISADGARVAAVGARGLACWGWTGDRPSHQKSFPTLSGHLVLVSPSEVVVCRPSTLVSVRGDARQVSTTDTVGELRAAVQVGGSDYTCVSAEGDITQYDLQFGKHQLWEQTRHRGKDWAVARRPDGPVAVSLRSNGQLVAFGPGTRTWGNFIPVKQPVTAFAISPDGRQVVAGTGSGWIGLAVTNGKWQRLAVLNAVVTALAFAPDGGTIAVGCGNGTVHAMGVDGEDAGGIQVSHRPITAVAISDRDDRIVALDRDGAAHCYDPDGHKAYHLGSQHPPATAGEPALGPEPAEVPVATAFTASDGGVLVAFADGPLSEVDVATGGVRGEIGFDTPVHDLAVVGIGGVPGFLGATSTGYWVLHEGGSVHLGQVDWAEARFRSEPAACIGVGRELFEVVRRGGTLSIRQFGPYAPPEDPLGEHPGCQVVHCAHFEGRPLVFTGGADGCVRVWDLRGRQLIDALDLGRPVWRIETVAGRHLLVGAGGELIAFEHGTGSAR